MKIANATDWRHVAVDAEPNVNLTNATAWRHGGDGAERNLNLTID